METVLEYFLKSAGVLGIFVLVYHFLLRRLTFFQANRWFLIVGIIASMVFPLVEITQTVYVQQPVVDAYYDTPQEFATPMATVVQQQLTPLPVTPDSVFDYWQLFGFLYVAVVVFFLGKMAVELSSLFRLIKSGKKIKSGKFVMVTLSRKLTPFSFFHYICYSDSEESSAAMDLIMQHEKVHASQWHSVDVLLSHLYKAVFWMNPLAWWLKKQIGENLEFIADATAKTQNTTGISYERTLLSSAAFHLQPSLANNFFTPFIKKRIMMLQKEASARWNAYKYALILPVIVLFLYSFNVVTEVEYVEPSVEVEVENQNQNQSENKNSNDFQIFKIHQTITDVELKKLELQIEQILQIDYEINATRDENGLIKSMLFKSITDAGLNSYDLKFLKDTELLLKFDGTKITLEDSTFMVFYISDMREESYQAAAVIKNPMQRDSLAADYYEVIATWSKDTRQEELAIIEQRLESNYDIKLEYFNEQFKEGKVEILGIHFFNNQGRDRVIITHPETGNKSICLKYYPNLEPAKQFKMGSCLTDAQIDKRIARIVDYRINGKIVTAHEYRIAVATGQFEKENLNAKETLERYKVDKLTFNAVSKVVHSNGSKQAVSLSDALSTAMNRERTVTIKITSTTTKEDLEGHKSWLKENHNVDFKYSKLKAKKGKIIRLKLNLNDLKGNKIEQVYDSNKPISDICITGIIDGNKKSWSMTNCDDAPKVTYTLGDVQFTDTPFSDSLYYFQPMPKYNSQGNKYNIPPQFQKPYRAISSGDKKPIIIIDGVIYKDPQVYRDVDASIIESITILKNKDATDTYGAAARDGAIIVVTKEGKGIENIMFYNAVKDEKAYVKVNNKKYIFEKSTIQRNDTMYLDRGNGNYLFKVAGKQTKKYRGIEPKKLSSVSRETTGYYVISEPLNSKLVKEEGESYLFPKKQKDETSEVISFQIDQNNTSFNQKAREATYELMPSSLVKFNDSPDAVYLVNDVIISRKEFNLLDNQHINSVIKLKPEISYKIINNAYPINKNQYLVLLDVTPRAFAHLRTKKNKEILYQLSNKEMVFLKKYQENLSRTKNDAQQRWQVKVDQQREVDSLILKSELKFSSKSKFNGTYRVMKSVKYHSLDAVQIMMTIPGKESQELSLNNYDRIYVNVDTADEQLRDYELKMKRLGVVLDFKKTRRNSLGQLNKVHFMMDGDSYKVSGNKGIHEIIIHINHRDGIITYE